MTTVGRRAESRVGITYMIAAMFLFSAVDAQSKYLSEFLPVLQIAWSRHFGLFIVVALVVLPRHGLGVLRTRHLALQLARGVMVVASSILFLVAITFVPLADAVAVSFIGPLVVTVLGVVILRERVGAQRWIAVFVGFCGAMIVIRPGLGALHPAALLVLGAASIFAVYQVLARFVSDHDSTATTLSYTAIVGAVMLSVAAPFVWQWPVEPLHVALFAGLGLWAAAAEFCVIKAFEAALAAVVAPFQYTMLLWSTMYGFVLFADLPDTWSLVGAGIVVATGLFVFHQERRAARFGPAAARSA